MINSVNAYQRGRNDDFPNEYAVFDCRGLRTLAVPDACTVLHGPGIHKLHDGRQPLSQQPEKVPRQRVKSWEAFVRQ